MVSKFFFLLQITALATLDLPNFQDTIRKMVQRLMTRSLAETFSFTGMGSNKQVTKTKFLGHPAYDVILRKYSQVRLSIISLLYFSFFLSKYNSQFLYHRPSILGIPKHEIFVVKIKCLDKNINEKSF